MHRKSAGMLLKHPVFVDACPPGALEVIPTSQPQPLLTKKELGEPKRDLRKEVDHHNAYDLQTHERQHTLIDV